MEKGIPLFKMPARRNFIRGAVVGAATFGLASSKTFAADATTHVAEIHNHILHADHIQTAGVRPAWSNWSPAKLPAHSLISFSSSGASGERGVAAVRLCNDYAADIVNTNKKHLFAVAGLPDLSESAYALTEIARCFEHGMVGVTVMTSYGDRWLDDTAFTPIMQELNRRRALVFIQPSVQQLGPATPVINEGRVAQQLAASHFVSELRARWKNIRFAAASEDVEEGVSVNSYWWGALPHRARAPAITLDTNLIS